MRHLCAILLLLAPVGCGPIRNPTAKGDPAPAVVEPGPDDTGATIAAPSGETLAGRDETAAPARVDFETEVRPILERCQPCHFEGGKMYDELPFDRPATIRKLGERLFTRIRDEQDQRIIRIFLAVEDADQDPAPGGASLP